MLQDDNQKNLMIAIALSVLVVLAWSFLIEQPRKTQQAAAPQAQQTQAAGPLPGATPAPAATPSATATSPVATPAAPTVATREAAISASPRIRIETPQITGSIRLAGAQIDDIRFNRYRESVEATAPAITLLSPEAAPDPYFVEFGWINAAGSAVASSDTIWTADRDTLRPGAPVTLRYDEPSGLRFERRITVDENFMFEIADRVTNSGAAAVQLQPYGRVMRVGTPATSGFFILHEGPIGVFDGKLQEPSYDDLKKKRELKFNATSGWLGITDKYWAVVMLPDQKLSKAARFIGGRTGSRDHYQADYLNPALTVAPGAALESVHRVFAGAKEVRLLDGYEDKFGIAMFDRVVDFGWFYWLTKPIFYIIDFFYNYFGNFGIAILLLTLVVKALFFPLANKSYRAMSKMKLMQPEMERIKEVYKGDQQKMREAMMEAYRKSGANPLAGCLPIVIQIPVFFALYKVLFVTIEMRHAPFYGWIKDLSAGDPTSIFNLFGLLPWGAPEVYLIGGTLGAWPVIMGITMYIQQKLNPAPPDPIQAKIFMFMPIFFTFMLAPFPAGLVIYWAWNNLLSVAQQWVIMRQAAAASAQPAK
jgi:YidC/Oxa1 family membrane protein insertase